jgi:hypothetical protein
MFSNNNSSSSYQKRTLSPLIAQINEFINHEHEEKPFSVEKVVSFYNTASFLMTSKKKRNVDEERALKDLLGFILDVHHYTGDNFMHIIAIYSGTKKPEYLSDLILMAVRKRNLDNLATPEEKEVVLRSAMVISKNAKGFTPVDIAIQKKHNNFIDMIAKLTETEQKTKTEMQSEKEVKQIEPTVNNSHVELVESEPVNNLKPFEISLLPNKQRNRLFGNNAAVARSDEESEKNSCGCFSGLNRWCASSP